MSSSYAAPAASISEQSLTTEITMITLRDSSHEAHSRLITLDPGHRRHNDRIERPRATAAGQTDPANRHHSYRPKVRQARAAQRRLKRIVSGRHWVEGPVWNRKEGYLLFSDIPTNSIIKWQEGKGTSVFLKPSGYTGTATIRRAGAGIQRPRLRSRRPPGVGGTWRPAHRPLGKDRQENHAGRPLRRQTDQQPQRCRVQIQRRSVLHRSALRSAANPTTTRAKRLRSKASTTLPKTASSRCSTKDLKAPNGIAFSPDEKTLYISNADPGQRGLDGFRC